jgi:antagonist of KipI
MRAHATVDVLKPGALSTFQDLGRTGYQQLGVPANGVMDECAHRLANWLAGNPASEATLEITLKGPELRFRAPAIAALAGADLSPTLDGLPLSTGEAIAIPAGGVLAFGRAAQGVRAYLAVRGGFALPPVMGSASTFVRGGYGGLHGHALQAGDIIALRQAADTRSPLFTRLFAPRRKAPALPAGVARSADAPLRVLAGREHAAFGADAQQLFASQGWRISPQSDRMGYRLQAGDKSVALRLAQPLELLSEAVCFGTVQVPPDGQPIVLMADRQTTGGYPKIAQVASVDLPRLAQRAPGETVRFEWITLEAAQHLALLRARVFDAMEATHGNAH